MGNGTRRHARRTIGTMLAVVATLGWFTTACAPDVGPLTPQQQVDQIIAFVESVRGHTFVTRPDVEFVPDAIFQQHNGRIIEHERCRLETHAVLSEVAAFSVRPTRSASVIHNV